MNKHYLLMTLAITAIMYFNTSARADAGFESKSINRDMDGGEEAFIEQADKCLALMEKSSQKISVTGVAIIAFIPGDATTTWISKMKVVGMLTNESANFLAIAYAKASEMASTYKNSGSSERESLTGETGWMGGIIKKVSGGYLLAAFSGGSGEQDAAISQEAVDWLSKYY